MRVVERISSEYYSDLCPQVIHRFSVIVYDVLSMVGGKFETLLCRVVESHEKETASSMMTVFMGVGLALGSGISLYMVKLL